MSAVSHLLRGLGFQGTRCALLLPEKHIIQQLRVGDFGVTVQGLAGLQFWRTPCACLPQEKRIIRELESDMQELRAFKNEGQAEVVSLRRQLTLRQQQQQAGYGGGALGPPPVAREAREEGTLSFSHYLSHGAGPGGAAYGAPPPSAPVPGSVPGLLPGLDPSLLAGLDPTVAGNADILQLLQQFSTAGNLRADLQVRPGGGRVGTCGQTCRCGLGCEGGWGGGAACLPGGWDARVDTLWAPTSAPPSTLLAAHLSGLLEIRVWRGTVGVLLPLRSGCGMGPWVCYCH